ncbi:uncharacterized protein LOC133330869 [Musca vetustissima]|uniref:uncharacterized protein LOC133330869 n=1 Tax=Musca vetustissima TaxID=27455 RepID=UPI002AB684C9|nr:uncharacterized protein LOC133330869 [Musca vetustissima]
MRPFRLFYVTAIVALGSQVMAVPIESTTGEVSAASNETVTSDGVKQPVTPGPNATDLETSNSNPEPTYVLPEHHSSAGSAPFDPSIYAGYLTPEAFQQYLAQFAGAFAPYAYPGYGAAPAPVYPGPFAVQTGYDGFLVPSVSANLAATGTAASTSVISNISTALQNLFTTLMSSTIFQMVLTALGALAMILFGGAITTAICNLTPICNISFKAVSYLRGEGAADVGRMLAEEMTPERVRRASEFVRNAIRKYKEMQNLMHAEENHYVKNNDQE